MITSNVLTRVFHIQFGQGTGTCFSIDFENKQYLVTARHVVEGLKSEDFISFFYKGNWTPTPVRLVGHHSSADVTVFVISSLISKLELDPTSDGITYGQDTFFLGFPYGIQDEKFGTQLLMDFPCPLVKKATLSLITDENSTTILLLDGINNPGFSGGPVVFTIPNTLKYKVAGIISGYRFSEEPAYEKGLPSTIRVRSNTGIIIAYDIKHAIELIKNNPIGKEIN